MLRSATALGPTLVFVILACSGPSEEVVGTKPAFRRIENTLTTNGRIEASDPVAVHTESAGVVAHVSVSRGDVVKSGQELLRLRKTGQGELREQALARLNVAKARLASLDEGPDPSRKVVLESERLKLVAARETAALELDRIERLVARDAAPRNEVEQQRSKIADLNQDIQALNVQLVNPVAAGQRKEAKAVVQEATAVLQQVESEEASLIIRVQRDGVVYSLHAREGDYLQQGDLVAHVHGTGNKYARVLIDEPDLGRIALGNKAHITVDAYSDSAWECEIDQLATEIVEVGSRRVGETSCVIDGDDDRLLPNLTVGVRIVTGAAEKALSVPRGAIHYRGREVFVWTVENGNAIERGVQLGVRGPAFVEVKQGMSSKDTVLLPNERELENGQRVHVVQMEKDVVQ